MKQKQNEIVQQEFQLGELCRPSRCGLEIADGTTYDQWRGIGKTLRAYEGAVQWWIGDWWRHGERAYGEMATDEAKQKLTEETGYEYDTIREYARVTSKFENAIRMANLSFKHHQIAADVEDPEKRSWWLQQAAEHKLSARHLKASIVAGHVVSIDELCRQAENRVSLNLIQGVVGHARLWMNNVAPKVKWTPELAGKLVAEVIEPLEKLCADMRAKLRGTTADADL